MIGMDREVAVWKRLTVHVRANAALLGLLSILLIYCLRALMAEFIGGHDLPSNLLPIIHSRRSILLEHHLPWYTDLWYGGRAQWQNPLWSFLYVPATFIWLIFSLNIGTTIVVVGHLLLAGWAAVKLAGLFVRSQIDRLMVALLFLSPIVVRLRYGHVEKLLAWPWVLLGLTFLLDERGDLDKRNSSVYGASAGLCLGIIPLTGANYYALYAAILFGLVALGHSRRYLLAFLGGASIGLLHLPSVAYLSETPRQFELSSVGLSTLGAESVWLSQEYPEDTLIPMALTQEGIALPNVYYGQMGQEIPVAGTYCGYSFDHLITHARHWPDERFVLRSDTYPRQDLGLLPAEEVEWVESVIVNGRSLHLFAVVCPPESS